ncbi:DIBD1 [Coccidioides immitis H538.4]|uniref:Mannosyltransferase n=1 Tax=Coccidioides immitis H538.4 TaxID=396776 RepID=A0A0J8RFD9_COCIT|nr:DIBD1 [Coccidioides immitis H538.4]
MAPKAPESSSKSSAAPQTNAKPVPQPFFLPLNVVFYLCLFSNVLAAVLAPIQDCDEVFNYWEPTHYLSHGYGLQTWEYSPEYSIRSWLYITLHAFVAKISTFFTRTKSAQFYFVRMALAFTCTMCETRLYSVISRTLNPRIGVLFLMIMLFSPGMFHASTALLPSSFAMYTSMLGLSAFLDCASRSPNSQGSSTVSSWLFLEHSGLHVFGGAGKGPDIFGTEPWTFYARNLLLNFNIWFVLALSSGPLLALQALFRPRKTSKQTLLRSITYLFPFYLWLGIFTFQPHKEERFMYPAYPFLALNAAIGLHILLAYLGSNNRQELVGRIPVKLKFAVIISAALFALNLGLLRIVGTTTAYNAPLKVFGDLEQPNITSTGDFVCVGKEWYRFPSSFFLPDNLRAKFVRSEFKGLLPGEFVESKKSGPFAGTWMVPSGMNDMNQEDVSKYVSEFSDRALIGPRNTEGLFSADRYLAMRLYDGFLFSRD